MWVPVGRRRSGRGRIGDGVILQFADPQLISGARIWARRAKGGRDSRSARDERRARGVQTIAKARDQGGGFRAVKSCRRSCLALQPDELPEELPLTRATARVQHLTTQRSAARTRSL